MKALGYTKETILEMGTSNRNFPDFKVGDTVVVGLKIKETVKEKDKTIVKERIQNFEGFIMGFKGYGINRTFRIRKFTDNIAVEKVLPYYSPAISSITVVKGGIVRRAKLYYLRDKIGKQATVKTKAKSKVMIAKANSYAAATA